LGVEVPPVFWDQQTFLTTYFLFCKKKKKKKPPPKRQFEVNDTNYIEKGTRKE